MGAHSRSTRRATRSHETLALVLRRTPYGESDLIVSVLTEGLGQVSALARAARKSQRRFGGSLEPLHTLEIELDEMSGADLFRLRDARIVTARPHLLQHLRGMEAAGKFLTWIRHAAPEGTPEPLVWALAQSCLEELEASARGDTGSQADGLSASARPTLPSAMLTLASHGLRLLDVSGWRLELEYCVQSGVRCPDGKSAMVDPERGGLVSRAHGGAPFAIDGAARRRLVAAQAGDPHALQEIDAELTLELVQRCLRAHAGLPG
jgi:DNA repair protein RecO (recombination protein O)